MKYINNYKIFEKNLLIPRNVETRKEKQLKMVYKQLQQEIFDGDLMIESVPITNLGNVKIINGELDLTDNKTLKSLGDLEKVDERLYLMHSTIEDLGNLKYVGLSIYVSFNKTLKSLGNLEECLVLYLNESNVEDLGNLKKCNMLILSEDTKVPPEQYSKFIHIFKGKN